MQTPPSLNHVDRGRALYSTREETLHLAPTELRPIYHALFK